MFPFFFKLEIPRISFYFVSKDLNIFYSWKLLREPSTKQVLPILGSSIQNVYVRSALVEGTDAPKDIPLSKERQHTITTLSHVQE